MTCVNPPELDDAVLLAYLDGERTQEVSDHLSGCDHCRKRAAGLHAQTTRLTEALFRFDCPDSLELSEFRTGLLKGEQADMIREHLAGCSACREEIDQLEVFIQDVGRELEVTIADRVKVIIGRLIEAGLPPAGPVLQPALAGVRGSGGGSRIYEAGDYRLALDVIEDTEAPDLSSLNGLFVGGDVEGWKVSLHHAGETVVEEAIDDLGSFTLSGLSPGSYVLIIQSEDAVFQFPDISVE